MSSWTGTTDPEEHSKLDKKTPDEAYTVMLPTIEQAAWNQAVIPLKKREMLFQRWEPPLSNVCGQI